jgi:HSP20 family protein
VEIRDGSLILSVDTADRKYQKELTLPDSIDVEGAQSSFNNGILEITFPKKSGQGKGVKLKID